MKKLLIILSVAFLTSNNLSFSAHIHKEKYYQNKWCNDNNGREEVVLSDGVRVDCLTDTYAVEFDFSSKWAESIGQALYYSLMTGKKPGVVLIIENPLKDTRYLKRLDKVARKYGITVWTINK